jgi:hypothetical protein
MIARMIWMTTKMHVTMLPGFGAGLQPFGFLVPGLQVGGFGLPVEPLD